MDMGWNLLQIMWMLVLIATLGVLSGGRRDVRAEGAPACPARLTADSRSDPGTRRDLLMPGLSVLDATVIGAYLAAMMGFGFSLARRQSD